MFCKTMRRIYDWLTGEVLNIDEDRVRGRREKVVPLGIGKVALMGSECYGLSFQRVNKLRSGVREVATDLRASALIVGH